MEVTQVNVANGHFRKEARCFVVNEFSWICIVWKCGIGFYYPHDTLLAWSLLQQCVYLSQSVLYRNG